MKLRYAPIKWFWHLICPPNSPVRLTSYPFTVYWGGSHLYQGFDLSLLLRCIKYHGLVVLQRNMPTWYQDTSTSRSVFPMSKHHKWTLTPLYMHFGPHKPTSNDSRRVLPTCNYDWFYVLKLSSWDTSLFIGSPCHQGSRHTTTHLSILILLVAVVTMCHAHGTALYLSSPTLILSNKLLRHQGFPYIHGLIIRLASWTHASKFPIHDS